MKFLCLLCAYHHVHVVCTYFWGTRYLQVRRSNIHPPKIKVFFPFELIFLLEEKKQLFKILG